MRIANLLLATAIALSAIGAPSIASADESVRTFDNEPIGLPPAGARTHGTATVQNVSVGGVSTRAVRVVDTSSTTQSRVLFLQNGLPAKRFAFDFLPRSTGQPTIFAVHGSGASEDTGGWRFLVRPATAGSTTGVIQVYNGSSWQALASVAGLHNPGAWSRITIDASATWAGITVGGKQYRTTVRAAAARDITSFEVASSGTEPTGTDAYIDNLSVLGTGFLVAAEPAGRQPRFPDLIKLADGRLMAVYHSAAAHTKANGVIKMTFSSDNGRSWSAPQMAVATGYDSRDPKIAQLADGTVLLSFFQTNWATPQPTNLGSFVARMPRGASTFSQPTKITSNQATSYLHAPAVQIPGGDVLQPLYGGGARIARSHDGGQTWDVAAEVFVARDTATYTFQEPNVTRLPSGELVMLIRTHDKVQKKTVPSFLTRSIDDGRTWTVPVQTEINTSSHHQLLTSTGSLLLTYGAPVTDRPTYGTLVANPAASWNGFPKTLIYDSGWADQANPSSVEIAPGRFLTATYNVVTRQLFVFETTTATYR